MLFLPGFAAIYACCLMIHNSSLLFIASYPDGWQRVTRSRKGKVPDTRHRRCNLLPLEKWFLELLRDMYGDDAHKQWLASLRDYEPPATESYKIHALCDVSSLGCDYIDDSELKTLVKRESLLQYTYHCHNPPTGFPNRYNFWK